MDFKEKLAMLVEVRGTSQKKLAVAAGLSQPDVSKMSSGERRPYMDQAFRLALALDVTLDYLADTERDEPPSPMMSERERQIRDVIRTIGIDEAWRRLLIKPGDGLKRREVLGRTVVTEGNVDLASGGDPVGDDQPAATKDRPS